MNTLWSLDLVLLVLVNLLVFLSLWNFVRAARKPGRGRPRGSVAKKDL